MSTRNFVIVDGDDVPAVSEAGGDTHGVIDLGVIRHALEIANRTYAHKDSTTAPMDDRYTLRGAIQDLSEAMLAVCGQLVQLEAGVRSGRISVSG
ncbi:hypothetical protein BH10ACT7_BH10ACT7_12160 [soil metagenome]